MFGVNYSNLGHIGNQGFGKPWSGLIRRLGASGQIHYLKKKAGSRAKQIIAETPDDSFSRRSQLQRLKQKVVKDVSCIRGEAIMNISKPIGRAYDFRSAAWMPKANLV